MPWGSTGWTNNRNVTQMLEYLMMRGEVAIAGRRGRQRLWDLAERVYPADCPILSVDEAHRIKNERRLQSLGIARARKAPPYRLNLRMSGTRATGHRRVHPRRLAGRPTGTRAAFHGRTAQHCCHRSTGSSGSLTP
jgi:hypothetical protein